MPHQDEEEEHLAPLLLQEDEVENPLVLLLLQEDEEKEYLVPVLLLQEDEEENPLVLLLLQEDEEEEYLVPVLLLQEDEEEKAQEVELHPDALLEKEDPLLVPQEQNAAAEVTALRKSPSSLCCLHCRIQE